jgi:hypothetical protein
MGVRGLNREYSRFKLPAEQPVPYAFLRVTMHRPDITRNNADRHVPSWRF